MDAAGFPVSEATDTRIPVLVAQLDKASDYESEDWGFKSLQGYFFIFVSFCDFFVACVRLAVREILCLDARGV